MLTEENGAKGAVVFKKAVYE